MKKSLHLADLKMMSSAQRNHRISELATEARQPPNGEVKAVEAKLRAFEDEYGFASSELRDRVVSGTVKEDAKVSSWLMLLDLQDRFGVSA